MHRILYLLLSCGLMSASVQAQSLQLSLPQVTVAGNETVTIPLTVADFDSIVSLQLSLNWDVDIAVFEAYEVASLPLLAVGDFQADQGQLRLSWFDNIGDGRSLEDGAVIANLTFRAVGSPGQFTDLIFTDNPLRIQIFRATTTFGVFEPVSLSANDGRIQIETPLGFTINTTDVSCAGAADGQGIASLAVDTIDYQLQWQGPNGFNSTGFTQTGLSGGVYELSLLDADGQVVFTTTINIIEATEELNWEEVDVENNDCNSANGQVRAMVNGGVMPYNYELGGLMNNDGLFTDLASGVYELNVTDANGCQLMQSLTLQAPDEPQLDLPDSLALCGSESIHIGTLAEGTYTWSTGDTTDSITVATIGTYTLTVTSAANCAVTDSVVVSSGQPPVAVLETDFLELCPGDTLQLAVSGGDVYQWISEDSSLSDLSSAMPMAFPDSTTQYTVSVSNDCGEDALLIELLVYQIMATAGPDTCVAPGDEAVLRASGGIFFDWQDPSGTLSALNISTPIAAPKDSTTYSVLITDINGCETLDQVTVLVANNPVESITAYNFISPNGDSKNDVLDFGEIDKFGTNSLKVYSRWGELVYQKLNYQSDEERFDGTYKEKPLPPGNYFYVLAFRQGEIRQTLTIIRE